jgi:uncharacterized membrane protein
VKFPVLPKPRVEAGQDPDSRNPLDLDQNTNEMDKKTWHQKHRESMGLGDRIADSVANGMGSWNFIIWQSAIVLLWMTLNIVGLVRHWDPYPFILLNLIFSTQAAYAAPIIMMAQNRQNERDREQALHDYQTDMEAKREIEALQMQLNKIEIEKLDKIIALLSKA